MGQNLIALRRSPWRSGQPHGTIHDTSAWAEDRLDAMEKEFAELKAMLSSSGSPVLSN